jgi:hypothetical protein
VIEKPSEGPAAKRMNRKLAGASVIVYALLAFAASISGLSGGVVMCALGPLVLLYLGTAIYCGSRSAALVAIVICAIHFISATKVAVSTAIHGINLLAAWNFSTSLVFGTWALLNMAMLVLFYIKKPRVVEMNDPDTTDAVSPPTP